ncbi:MAG: hypothetical protein AAF514_21935 [Verrucomicrobiota bacterium]
MAKVLNVIVTHQNPDEVANMLAWWRGLPVSGDLLIAYGGDRETFAAIEEKQKVFIEDERLRTADHQRERQSYQAVVVAASRWMEGRDFTHVHLAEFDQIPVVANLNQRQITRMNDCGADLLVHFLKRIDGTSNPHFLCHASDDSFEAFWRRISLREDPRVTLSGLGCGLFWKREVFDKVASLCEIPLIYLEIFFPTAAHHLGYRVQDFGDQNEFAHPDNRFEKGEPLVRLTRPGKAWYLHPVKDWWGEPRALPGPSGRGT